MNKRLFFDHLVIGSGAAGLPTALMLAKTGTVAVVTKREIDNTNTNYAQGRVVCVIDNEFLSDIFTQLLNANIDLVSGALNPRLVMENLIVKICKNF